MGDFLGVALNLMLSKSARDATGQFETVFKAVDTLQAVHSKAQLDLTNIESIFTTLEIAKVLGKLPGFEPEDIPEVIESLKALIVKTLELSIHFPTSGSYIQPTKAYKEFAALIQHMKTDAFPQQSVAVISFNYGVGVDVGLFAQEMGPDYGFGSASSSS